VARRWFDAASGPADSAIAPGEFVCLRVRDNGSGMTREVQSHLFEPFFTTKEAGKGTGLGLAFVYGIVRQHRGFITVDTAPAMGTTFTVCLPLAAGEATAGALEPAPPSLVEGRQGATILLVEDDPAVREVTTRTLRGAGYHVLEAATPGESSAIFDAHPDNIDLLMADVIMPGMHGPALAQRLVSKRPQLRVLLVSGYSDALPVVTAPGKIAFLGKPFTAAQLIAILAELLALHAPDDA
jgi:two-component system cell cycle sensor histidine kinase/response regulator CckA